MDPQRPESLKRFSIFIYLVLLVIVLIPIIIGIIFIVISSLTSKPENTKVAVGGFIGFIPFGFANDKRMFYILIALILILFITTLILRNSR